MVGLKLVESTKVTKILEIKNLKYTSSKAEGKWKKEREGDNVAVRGLKKIGNLFASPSQEDWERAKAGAKWQVDRLQGSATAQVCIDLKGKLNELIDIVRDVQADKEPNYGKGIQRLRQFEDKLALEWTNAQKKEKDPSFSAVMGVYQEVSKLLYRARGVVRGDIYDGWEKEMAAHGLPSLDEVSGGIKKNTPDVHRKAMEALRDQLKAGDGEERAWGVATWYEKVGLAHEGLAKLNLQVEAMADPLPKQAREAREGARQAAIEIDKLIAERKIGEALTRLQDTSAKLPPLKGAAEVKTLFKTVLDDWKNLPQGQSSPSQGTDPSAGERAKVRMEIDQLRMFCSVSGAGSDPMALPDGLATPELHQRLKALEDRIAKLKSDTGKGGGQTDAPPLTPWEQVQAAFEKQEKSLRAALKTLEAFPALMLKEKMNEKVPAAISACDAVVEKGAEANAEDTSPALAEIKKLEALETQVNELVKQAKGGDEAEKEREKMRLILNAFDNFFVEAKDKVAKDANPALKTWLDTMEMDSASLRTLIETAGADELKSLGGEILQYSKDIAEARKMVSGKGKSQGEEFGANTKKAKELKKALTKLFAKGDFKDSRAGDFADFSKRLEDLEGRIPATEPSRLAQELAQFEQEINTYKDEEEKNIEAARTLLKERFDWLAVVYDREKGFKTQIESAQKNGGRNKEAENHLAYLEVVKRTIAAFEKDLTASLSATDAVKLQAETIKAEILKLQQSPPQYPTGQELAAHGTEAEAFDKARAAMLLFQQGALKAVGEYDPRKELAGKLRAALKTGLDELDKTRDVAKAERLLTELKARLQKGEPSPVSKRGDLRKMLDQHNTQWREQTGRFNKEVLGLLQEIERAKIGEADDVGEALSALAKRIEPLAGIFSPQAFTRAFDALADASGEKAVARAREPIMATVREVRSLIQSTPAFRVLDGMPFQTKPTLGSISSVLTQIETNVMHRHG